MQTQSENRFTKIEAELTSFIPVKVYYVIDRLHGSAALQYQATQKETQERPPDVAKLFDVMRVDFQLEEVS